MYTKSDVCDCTVKLIGMETNFSNKVVNVSAYKISLAKQLEENARRLQEHKQRILDQQKKTESQKQEIMSFVCDWQ
jgi:uncharacterized protein (DUF2344 family)